MELARLRDGATLKDYYRHVEDIKRVKEVLTTSPGRRTRGRRRIK
jgi:hypothetical protein